MKKYELKLLKHSAALLGLLLFGTQAVAAETLQNRAELLAKLIAAVGPEKAADFIARLEQKHNQRAVPQEPIAKPKPKAPEKPKAPVVQDTPQPRVPATPVEEPKPQAPVVPETPQPKPSGLNEEDAYHLNQIISKITTYMTGTFGNVKQFLDKQNSEPYKGHVQKFKDQLKYLRFELLHEYPQAQSPEGAKLLKSLFEICKALEKGQELMIKTVDYNYGTGFIGASSLGLALQQLEKPVSKLRATIDKQIGELRNHLRNAKETELLAKLNDMYKAINTAFDYPSTKSKGELAMILGHRVKR